MNRVKFLILTAVLVGVEYWLMFKTPDQFMKTYVAAGVLILVASCALRILVPEGLDILPFFVCAIALCIEILKLFDLFYKAKIHKIPGLKLMFGGKFDIKMLIAYAAGALIAVIVSRMISGEEY